MYIYIYIYLLHFKEVGTESPVDDFKAILADKEQDRFKTGNLILPDIITDIP